MASRALGVAVWAMWIALAAAVPMHTPRTLTVKSSYSTPWTDIETVEYVKLEVLCPGANPGENEQELARALGEMGVSVDSLTEQSMPGDDQKVYYMRNTTMDEVVKLRDSVSHLPIRVTELKTRNNSDEKLHALQEFVRNKALTKSREKAASTAENLGGTLGNAVEVDVEESYNANMLTCQVMIRFDMRFPEDRVLDAALQDSMHGSAAQHGVAPPVAPPAYGAPLGAQPAPPFAYQQQAPQAMPPQQYVMPEGAPQAAPHPASYGVPAQAPQGQLPPASYITDVQQPPEPPASYLDVPSAPRVDETGDNPPKETPVAQQASAYDSDEEARPDEPAQEQTEPSDTPAEEDGAPLRSKEGTSRGRRWARRDEEEVIEEPPEAAQEDTDETLDASNGSSGGENEEEWTARDRGIVGTNSNDSDSDDGAEQTGDLVDEAELAENEEAEEEDPIDRSTRSERWTRRRQSYDVGRG